MKIIKENGKNLANIDKLLNHKTNQYTIRNKIYYNYRPN